MFDDESCSTLMRAIGLSQLTHLQLSVLGVWHRKFAVSGNSDDFNFSTEHSISEDADTGELEWNHPKFEFELFQREIVIGVQQLAAFLF